MKRLSVRFPQALYQAAQAYARHVGLSLNALLLVALVDYLDARGIRVSQPPASQPPVERKRGKRKR